MKISATIITLNEAEKLERALRSLSGIVDEIIVVDSGSSDRTIEIAREHKARVFGNDWPGYAAQKNFAAAQATHDWILSLDADEVLSPELAAEIFRLKSTGPGDRAAFSMPRMARYCGRWIRHGGWYPDRKIRLYDRRRARWAGDYVHESVRVEKGAVGELSGHLRHFTCDSLAEHLDTLDRYTTLAAREAVDNGVRLLPLRLLVAPPWKFFETYVARLGFLDGYQGFLIACMAAYYLFLKYAKAWKLARGAPLSSRARGAAPPSADTGV